MADYLVRDTELEGIADAIRQKGGTSAQLMFPTEFVTAIGNISGGTLQTKSVSHTPTESAFSTTVTPDEGYDGLSSVSVSVAAVASNYVGTGITRRSSTDLTASDATVSVPSGYYSTAASKAVATGSATAPASISGTAAELAAGTNTLTLSKLISVTPTVSTGYVSSGTARAVAVSLTGSVTTKAAATYTPTTTSQTIAAGTYLTGAQTISGDANLVAGNIKDGTTIFGVTGTYSGGGTPAISVTTQSLSGGGEEKIITGLDISDTTATASDVASGKYFYTANGVKTQGTASGGGSVSYGTFTATNTMNTSNIYVVSYERPSTSVFPDKVPVVIRVKYNIATTYTGVIASDGYMYIALVGPNDAYWPTCTATSGTATQVHALSVNSSSLGSFPMGTFVWYKVTPNATLSVSYYNNN